MKTAYLINCHKNMDHVARLAHRLHSENSHIFIHVDKKVPLEMYENLQFLTRDLKHCHISKTRINGRLDDRSLVDIVFALISDAKQIAQQNSVHYSYYSNMSGQDYPIKPLSVIEEKLETNYPAIYMHYRDTTSASWVAKKFNRNKALIRYRDWALKCKVNIIRKFLQGLGVFLRQILKLFGQTASQRIIKNGWKYYQGSAWWVFPDYVIDAIEKEYDSQTKFSTIMIDESTTPEETYFQSMVMHLFYSDLAKTNNLKTEIQNHKTYVDFGPPSNRPQTCHPYILTMNDYERLCQSDCWYARKFDDAVDSDIINKIDATLL
ncbi:MAG: hypothetical protein J6Q30_04835 [Oscillospiraceae bacterium]|nr:hypothetical protein [Oscillospiraceae bacterium]